MGYTSYYGLSRPPFGLAVDPAFYFDAPPHAAALFKLAHAIDNAKGLALLVGAGGAGKTMLCRRLLDAPVCAHQSGLTFLIAARAGLTSLSLLRQIAARLKADADAADRTGIFSAIHDRLLELARQRRNVVFLIDDGDLLAGDEIRAEIHGLLKIESDRGMLLNFILFGRPAAEEYLRADPGLFQRIALRCALDPLDETATRGYITHRLQVAGGSGDLFDATALGAVHFHARGNPALTNTICDNAMLEGSRTRRMQIDAALVDAAAENLGLLKRVN